MHNLQILQDSLARIKAEPVPEEKLMEIYGLCVNLEQLCINAKGIGLHAVQVGVPWRLFVVNGICGFEYFANCQYVGIGEMVPSIEGCLSLGQTRYKLKRFSKIRLTGQKIVASSEKPVFVPIDMFVEGLYSAVFQHEIDHESGILVSDLGKPIDLW